MFIYVVILSALAQSLIALFVLQRNSKHLTNLLFFILSVCMVAWAAVNFWITNDAASPTLLFQYRLLMASVVAQNTAFYLFAHTYPGRKLEAGRRRLLAYLCLSALALTATLTPVVFVKLHATAAGPRPVTGPGMLLFGLHAAVSVIAGLRALYHRYKRAHGIARQQLLLIFYGSIILWGIVPITNFLVSLATETLFFARISPVYILAFSSVIAYAIVARKLFSIRAAVARSVTYMLTLLTLATFYIAVAFTVSTFLLDARTVDMQIQLTYTLLALSLAFGFQPVKRLFDRVTTPWFYQDAYDRQELINRLSRILVATMSVDQLLAKTTALMQDRLKAEFVVAVLVSSGAKAPRVVGAGKRQLTSSDLAAAHAKLSNSQSHRHIIVTDNLGPDEAGLRDLLVRNHIAVLVQLTGRGHDNDKEFGHIILGAKKSGNPYETRDIQVIEAVADELVVAIQNALRFEEIENFNLTLQAKVDEATRQLRRTNEKLQTLDATKDEFISMASHQLRTPLTSVKGYLSMVLEGDVGPINAQQRQMLEQSYNSSQRMVYLISDLLNLSRLNTGKFVIESTSVDLGEVVQAEVEQLTETAKSRGLSLVYHRPNDFPRLMLDETKIHQVVMNLIDNAIYYTPSGGTVTVDLTETASAVEFRVTDTGIGVPKKVQHKLFSKFYRAGNAQAARPDGTGLGLFMAKKVVAAQGGAILFESTEGKGSAFGFRFTKVKHVTPTVSTGAGEPALAAARR